MKDHYRLVIYLAAYDPYKDIFDIFIEQFKKCWPDCPYPLVIANMYFQYEGDNIIVINCGDANGTERRQRALDVVDADYYLGMEEDRIFSGIINTRDIEEILDFMDKESIGYYRCNASIFKKKSSDRYPGYKHAFHIPAKEPYGVCGSTIITSKEYLKKRNEDGLANGYAWESYHLKRAYSDTRKWVDGYATDDRNVFHIVHCIEKQKWIPKSKKIFQEMGYDVSGRESQSKKEAFLSRLKEMCKRVPVKYRYWIKKIGKKIGFHFVTEY